jgi:hypothetical protein
MAPARKPPKNNKENCRVSGGGVDAEVFELGEGLDHARGETPTRVIG